MVISYLLACQWRIAAATIGLVMLLVCSVFALEIGGREIKIGVWEGEQVEYAAGDIIFKLRPNYSVGDIQDLLSSNNAVLADSLNILNIGMVHAPDTMDVFEILDNFNSDYRIEFAEPNQVVRFHGDSLWICQWNLENECQTGGTFDADIDADLAWQIETGDNNVKIAIIDTGLPFWYDEGRRIYVWGHPDIDSLRFSWKNITSRSPSSLAVDEPGQHGTQITGIIAAIHDNDIGIKGISPDCQFLSIKITWGDTPRMTYEKQLHDAIVYAVDQGANVMNISGGMCDYSKSLEEAVSFADSLNRVIVVSAGNGACYSDSVEWPARFAGEGRFTGNQAGYENVIAVGGTDDGDALASGSCHSDLKYQVIVSAPEGVGVGSETPPAIPDPLHPRGGIPTVYLVDSADHCTASYSYFTGTSAAAPHVTGVVALLQSYNSSLRDNAPAIRDYIQKSAEKVHPELYGYTDGRSCELGYGRLNAYWALLEAGAGIKGDINDDDNVMILDVLYLISYFCLELMPNPTDYQQWAADMNYDGNRDVCDAVLITNAVLGIGYTSPLQCDTAIASLVWAEDTICEVWVKTPVNLKAVQTPFHHEASAIDTVQKTDRTANLVLSQNNDFTDSLITVLYDGEPDTTHVIEAGNGPILRIAFSGDPNPTLGDVVLSTPEGTEVMVVINHQPNTPSNPSPSDGALNQATNIDLSWSGGDPDQGNTVTYDVYLDTSPVCTTLVVSNHTSTTYDPDTLQYGYHYYWRIVAYDNHGVPTYGPLGWDFTTGTAPCDTPSISSISQTSGQVDVIVTINGSNFGSSQGASYVMFNGAQATQYTLWGATQIKCKVPACAIKGNVTVVTCATSNGKLFSVTPYISNISPTSGGIGTTVTVNGTGFGSSRGSSCVKFNTTQATNYTSWGCSQVKCTVPSGASDGYVKVTTDGGTSNGKSFDVTCSPPVPTGLAGSWVPGQPSDHPRITWNSVSTALYYKVYKSLDSGPYTFLAYTPDTTTAYIDSGFCSGGGLVDMVRYKVSQVDQCDSTESAMTSNYVQFRGYQCAQSKLVAEAPEGYLLFQNYPNPFNPETEIAFGLADPSYVRLVVYNILGQEVRVIVDWYMDGGYHTLRWDSRNEQGDAVPAGVYLYRLETNQFSDTKRMVLLK